MTGGAPEGRTEARSKCDVVGQRLGRDVSEWVSERRLGGDKWAAIANQILSLTGVSVSERAVAKWATENREHSRQQAREQVRLHRQRYGNNYEVGRSRAMRRAMAMFRDEHPEVWQRLLDEECGEFRALPVARRGTANRGDS